MSRMSDLHADAERVAHIIPIRAASCAPPPCPEYLAERCALAVMAAWGEARAQRAELIRAAAAGDAARAQQAMKGWNDEQL